MIGLALEFTLCCFVHSASILPILEESKHLADAEFEIIPTSSIMEAREEPNALPAGPAPVIECSSSGKSSTWEPEPIDAPGG